MKLERKPDAEALRGSDLTKPGKRKGKKKKTAKSHAPIQAKLLESNSKPGKKKKKKQTKTSEPGKVKAEQKPATKTKLNKKLKAWKLLMRERLENRQNPNVEHFHRVTMENILVYSNDKFKYFNRKVKRKTLAKLATNDENSYVLIKSGSYNSMHKISIKRYLELCKFEHVVLDCRIALVEDGYEGNDEDDIAAYVNLIDQHTVISNLNDLVMWMNRLESANWIIYGLMLGDWWYNVVDVRIRVMTVTVDGDEVVKDFYSIQDLKNFIGIM